MKMNGFKCDQCSNIYSQSLSMVSSLPLNWFSLTRGNAMLGNMILGNTEKHFCSIECLMAWASTQTVDSRKLDTEGSR